MRVNTNLINRRFCRKVQSLGRVCSVSLKYTCCNEAIEIDEDVNEFTACHVWCRYSCLRLGRLGSLPNILETADAADVGSLLVDQASHLFDAIEEQNPDEIFRVVDGV